MTFRATWEGDFYRLRADSQPFEPDKLCDPFQPDIDKLQHHLIGGYGIFRMGGRKGLNCLSEIGSNLTNTISRRIDIMFDLTILRNPSTTVFAIIPLRFKDSQKCIPISSKSTNRISPE